MKHELNAIKSFVVSSPGHHSIIKPRPIPKYRFVILLAGIAMLITSCHKEDNHHKNTVPLKGEFVASVTVIVPPSPGVLEQLRITGKGSGTPFGKATFEENVKVDVTASPETVKGTETITAENGDQIFSTVSGYVSPPDAKGNYQVFNTSTITGGTGKYAGATGTYKETYTGNIAAPTSTAVFDGNITY
ncbi:MAG: hypothetical protein ABIN89_12230 [Chitinophagaceae bacterium]